MAKAKTKFKETEQNIIFHGENIWKNCKNCNQCHQFSNNTASIL